MLPRSDFDREGEVVEVAGKIASDSLYALDLDRVLLDGVMVSNIDWLGLLCALYTIDL